MQYAGGRKQTLLEMALSDVFCAFLRFATVKQMGICGIFMLNFYA
jgi:hypothetical protein